MYRFSIPNSIHKVNFVEAETLDEYTTQLHKKIYENQQIIHAEHKITGIICGAGFLLFWMQMPFSLAGLIAAAIATLIVWIALEVIRKFKDGRSGAITLSQAKREQEIWRTELSRCTAADAKIKSEPA